MKFSKYHLLFLLLLSNTFVSVFAQVAVPVKVACIGNSITYGAGLKNRNTEAYPIKLKDLLDKHYSEKSFEVENFAVSGTTMLKDPNDGNPTEDYKQHSYWELKDDSDDGGGRLRYDAALAWKPDIVIIKFGTNDARKDIWKSDEGYGKENFYDTYVEFINSFRAVNPNVIIYICYSLPSFKTRTEQREQARIIREEVIPIIKQIAKKNQTHLIDLHSVFYDGVNRGLILDGSDLIHPTAEGATLIAEEVFKMIKMTYKP